MKQHPATYASTHQSSALSPQHRAQSSAQPPQHQAYCGTSPGAPNNSRRTLHVPSCVRRHPTCALTLHSLWGLLLYARTHPKYKHGDARDGEADAELEKLHAKLGLGQVFCHHCVCSRKNAISASISAALLAPHLHTALSLSLYVLSSSSTERTSWFASCVQKLSRDHMKVWRKRRTR